MENKKGFTLIELLASISLIILLFTAIVPMSVNLVEKSNKEQCEKIANVIETNAELCVIDKNSVCISNDSTYNVTLIDLYNNGYIEEKYVNKYKEEEITKENNYNDYRIKITKKNVSGLKGYFLYQLVDINGNDPCN